MRRQKRSVLQAGGILVLLGLGGLMALKGGGGFGGLFAGQGKELQAAEPVNGKGKYDEDRSKKAKRSREDIQRMAERWYHEILEKHPEMKVTFKDVPDERNGFLQLLNFMDRFGKDGLPLPDDIRAMIGGGAPWDAVAMAKWLEENRALFDEIKAIGLLDEQSVKGIDMDRLKFFGARVPSDCSKLLLASARLAMERGDEAAALQSAQAAFGLADHMDRMELPSLLSETVSVLIRQNVRKAVLKEILGAAGETAPNMDLWRGLLGSNPETPADLAKVFLGEWHHTARSYLLPAMLGDPEYLPMLMDSSQVEPGTKGEVRDPDAVVEAHVRYFSQLMEEMKSSELSGLAELSANPPDKTGLSQNGGAILDVLFVGASAWSKGWTRSQTDAAISYAALQAASGGELPLEPYTGKPFVVDREAGTVSAPDDPWFESMNYPPVRIPVVKGR